MQLIWLEWFCRCFVAISFHITIYTSLSMYQFQSMCGCFHFQIKTLGSFSHFAVDRCCCPSHHHFFYLFCYTTRKEWSSQHHLLISIAFSLWTRWLWLFRYYRCEFILVCSFFHSVFDSTVVTDSLFPLYAITNAHIFTHKRIHKLSLSLTHFVCWMRLYCAQPLHVWHSVLVYWMNVYISYMQQQQSSNERAENVFALTR